MRSDSPKNSAQRVLRRLLGQISTKTAKIKEFLALTASDRMAAYRESHKHFQGVQTLEARTLLSADFAIDDVNEITELAAEVQVNSVSGLNAHEEFLVNSETMGYQVDVATTTLNNGNVVAVWYSVSTNQDGDQGGIYAQLFTEHGTAIGNEFLVNSTIAGDQTEPVITSLTDGGFVVVWHETSSDPSPVYRVNGQRFDSTGLAVGSEFQVNSTALQFNEGYPRVQGLSTGGFTATWSAADQIFVQFYDVNGVKSGAEVLVAQPLGSDILNRPNLTELNSGKLIVVWEEFNGVNVATTKLKAQVVNADGTLSGSQFEIAGSAANASSPTLIGFGSDYFGVAWEQENAGQTDIYYSLIYSVSPVPHTPDLIASTSSTDYRNPYLTRLNDGNLLIVFEGRDSSTIDEVYGQRIDIWGTTLGQQFQLNTTTAERQRGPVATPTSSGFMSFWRSLNQDGDGYGIYGARFGTNGDPAGGNGIFANDTYPQNYPLVIYQVNGEQAFTTPPSTDTFVTFDGQYGSAEFNIFNGEYTYTLDDTNPEVNALFDGETLVETFVVTVTDSEFVDTSNLNITIHGVTDGPLPDFVAINDTNSIDELVHSTATNSVSGLVDVGVVDEFQVNTYTADYQGRIDSAKLNDGSVIIIWTSEYQDGDLNGIFGQRYDSSGNAIGSEFQVNWDAAGDQIQPAVAALSDGGFVITWTDAGSTSSIEARRFDSSGNAVGGDITISGPTTDILYSTDVVGLSGGGFIATWNLEDSSMATNVQARRYDASGTALGAAYTVASEAGDYSTFYPKVVELSSGDVLHLWQKNYVDPITYDRTGELYFQQFDLNGASVSSTQLVHSSSDNQSGPEFLALDDGGFLVTWAEDGSSKRNAYVKRFDNSLASVTGAVQVNPIDAFDYNYPHADELVSGDIVVTLSSRDPNNIVDDESWGQLFDNSLNKIGGLFQLNTTTVDNQRDPEPIALDDGNFLAIWRGASAATSYDVFGKRFDANGGELTGGGSALFENDTNNAGLPLSITSVITSSGTYSPVGNEITAVGLYGTAVIDVQTGGYTYTLDDANPAVDVLNDGDTLVDSFDVNVTNGSHTDNSLLNITINGATEFPLPTDDLASVTEVANDPFGISSYSGNIFANDASEYQSGATISDVDGVTPDQYDFVFLSSAYGNLSLNVLSGDFTYDLDNYASAVDALNDGESLLDSFTVNFTNPHVTSSDINVTIDGATDVPPADDDVSVDEVANDPFGISSYSGNIFTNDASDYQSGATISDVSGETPDSYGYVFVSSAYGFLQLNVSTGDFSYDLDNSAAAVDALNNGETLLDSFTVNFTSPRVTSSDINVTINGATDAPPADDDVSVDEVANDPFGISSYSGNIFTNDASDYQSGATISDVSGETPDSYGYVFVSSAYGFLQLNVSTGDFSYDLDNSAAAVDALNNGETLLDSFTVNFTDPRVTSSDINVTINGATDAPPADDDVSVDEVANDPLGISSYSGNIFTNDASDYQSGATISDVSGETPDSYGYVFVSSAYGFLQLNVSTGDFSYDLDNSAAAVDALNNGETLLDSFTVNFTDPRVTSSDINVTIDGATDVPPADDDVSVDEVANDPFGISSYSGNIFTNDASDYQSGATISDVSGETPDSYGYVFVSSAYGFLQLNVSTGDFSYDLDNSAAAVDALNNGETLLDSFTVNFTDPRVTSSDINVTINGATDAPPADDDVSVDEVANDPFGISSYSGNIFTNDASDYQSGATISDVSGETPDSYGYVFVSSAYGFLQLNVSTGDFSYDLDNSAAAVDALNNGETLLDSFTVNFTDPRVTSSDINVTINGVTDTQAMGETGIIDVSNGSASVALNGTYVNPVVFASSTQNESDPVAVRIDNLSSTGFDIILAEPSNMDGVHATEQVHYYVFEAGVWQLEDGSIVEVGTTQSTNLHNNSRESIGFEHAFASSDLTVLTHLQTNNNSGWYHTRHGNSTQSGVEFLIQTEEIDGSSTLPIAETVGYLALESGSGTWDAGTLFEAIQTPNSVKHGWYQVNYAQSFSTTPAVVSTLSTFDGMDDSNTRIRNTSSTGVQVRIAEDTTKDSETNHTTERVDLLAIEAGVQLNGVKIEAEALDIGETGTVSFQNSTSVTITRAFTAPVVFAAVSNNGADPVVVRVDNLTVDSVAGTTTFDLLLAETSNSDGVTAVETVNYMVMEAGTWRLEDGTQVVVGTHNTATTTLKSNKVFDTISTPSMNSPVVMTQLQTNNNSGWVSTRVRNKAATSFQVALEPEEGNQVVFPNAESIGYMVIEAGGGTWDGMDYFAASTPDQVTQNNYAIDLGGLNAADAYFVGSLSKYDGADPSRIRFSNDLTNILVTVEEDTTSDSEVGHTTEAIDYFLFTGVQTLTGFAAE